MVLILRCAPVGIIPAESVRALWIRPTQLATFITIVPEIHSTVFVCLPASGRGDGVVALVGLAMSSRSVQRFRLVNSKVEGRVEGG